MSYSSARDKLFLAAVANRVVRLVHLGDYEYKGYMDVYRLPHDMSLQVFSVCYMRNSDTLLVFFDEPELNGQINGWMVALSRIGREWREEHRLQLEKNDVGISCALSDSRVLIGSGNSTYMQLLRMQSDSLIERVHRIDVSEKYCWFSATYDRDTLVAMSYYDQSVRVH